MKAKIDILTDVEVTVDPGPSLVQAARERLRRPAIAMTTDGREHIVNYPDCTPWRGVR